MVSLHGYIARPAYLAVRRPGSGAELDVPQRVIQLLGAAIQAHLQQQNLLPVRATAAWGKHKSQDARHNCSGSQRVAPAKVAGRTFPRMLALWAA